MRRLFLLGCGLQLLALSAAPLAAQPDTKRMSQTPFPFSEAVRQGDMLYLSGQIGVAPGAAKPVDAGLAAEASQTMDNIGAILRRNGLGFQDIVRCLVMLSDMTKWPEFNRVYATYFPDGNFPARSAMGVSALALGAGVEVECTARFPAAAVNPGTPLGPYSQAVRANGMIYISGVIAFDQATGRFAEADIDAQLNQVFANLDQVLAGAEISRANIVKTTLLLRSARDMAVANRAYAHYFDGLRLPARTTIPGADWGRPDIMVEIEAIAMAHVPEGDSR